MSGLRDFTIPTAGTDWTAWGQAVDAHLRRGEPGVIQIDDPTFGATDALKMQGAIDYVVAERNAGRFMPWLQLPMRTFDTGTATFQLSTGVKICGPGMPLGPKNLEISSGSPVAGKWKTTCGNGASSLLQMTATAYDVMVVGVAFHGGSTSQIFRSTVNAYAGEYSNLTFYGCKHAFGSPTEKFLATQVRFTEHFTMLSFTDTQLTIGGSDNHLMWYVNANSPSALAGGGKPIIIMDSAGKTDVHYNYLTCENDWVGMRIIGGLDRKTTFIGGTYEGRGASNLATRPVIDVQGGHSVFYSPHLGYVDSASATVSGVIHQSGGIIDLYSPTYLRGSAVAGSFPLLYQTGGTAWVTRPVSSMGEQIGLRWSSGTTDTLPLPSNGYTA